MRVSIKKKNVFFILLLSLFKNYSVDYDWAIIGAGPAGIAVAGLLLDLGVPGDRILWVDPEFNVGRLGKHYSQVPGNAPTKLYIEFINSCKTFLDSKSPAIAELNTYNLESEYQLYIIVNPLRDITRYLRTLVHNCEAILTGLNLHENEWQISIQGKSEENNFSVRNVILAHGSHPKTLDYPCAEEIPLDSALKQDELARFVTKNDGIAVIGGSHSAMLVMKNLTELPSGRIINFYNKPYLYAVDMGTWTLNSRDGLNGAAAQFAREILEKNPPVNLLRVLNTQEARDAWLPACNKIVYAIGYERNPLPEINGSGTISYDDTTGLIAPRLFGIGIAFPERITNPAGIVEHRIGLSGFMKYAQRVVPQWLVYNTCVSRLALFDELFDISLL